MNQRREMCPICTQPFQDGEIVILYRTWRGDSGTIDKAEGHLDCALALSRGEKRKHPPRS